MVSHNSNSLKFAESLQTYSIIRILFVLRIFKNNKFDSIHLNFTLGAMEAKHLEKGINLEKVKQMSVPIGKNKSEVYDEGSTTYRSGSIKSNETRVKDKPCDDENLVFSSWGCDKYV